MKLAELNALDAHGFATALGGVFEHSPWIVARTHRGPFASVDALHRALIETIDAATTDEQLALLRAHPELAGSAALAGELTAASKAEQASAGLATCTREDLARLAGLNRRYRERFGFPFIIAVRDLDRQRILDEFARRIERDRDIELCEALAQVARIARLRLDALVGKCPTSDERISDPTR